MLKILDVITAKTPAERHSRALQLHVAVRTEAASDGRDGVVRSFSVRGKLRIREFIPTQRSVTAEASASVPPFGGPYEPNLGRWKVDGYGGCYWDPDDSGGDQCDPSGGRWKLDGNGGCYFANDTGSNQCTPPSTGQTCTDDYYGTGPCATQQEIDDAQATLAAMEAEADDYSATYDAEYADLEAYCSQYPSNCQEEQTANNFGPSAFGTAGSGGCWDEAETAALGVADMSLGLYGIEAAVSVGVTTGGLGLALAGAFLLGYHAGVGIRGFLQCKGALPKLEPPIWLVEESTGRY